MRRLDGIQLSHVDKTTPELLMKEVSTNQIAQLLQEYWNSPRSLQFFLDPPIYDSPLPPLLLCLSSITVPSRIYSAIAGRVGRSKAAYSLLRWCIVHPSRGTQCIDNLPAAPTPALRCIIHNYMRKHVEEPSTFIDTILTGLSEGITSPSVRNVILMDAVLRTSCNHHRIPVIVPLLSRWFSSRSLLYLQFVAYIAASKDICLLPLLIENQSRTQFVILLKDSYYSPKLPVLAFAVWKLGPSFLLDKPATILEDLLECAGDNEFANYILQTCINNMYWTFNGVDMKTVPSHLTIALCLLKYYGGIPGWVYEFNTRSLIDAIELCQSTSLTPREPITTPSHLTLLF